MLQSRVEALPSGVVSLLFTDVEGSTRLLHELGECEVKHGEKVSVVNLYTDELGNAALPARFAKAQAQPPAAPQIIAPNSSDHV